MQPDAETDEQVGSRYRVEFVGGGPMDGQYLLISKPPLNWYKARSEATLVEGEERRVVAKYCLAELDEGMCGPNPDVHFEYQFDGWEIS